MVKGKTKSGIKFEINEAIKEDTRLVYLCVQMQREDVPAEKKAQYIFDLLSLIFGEDGVMPFMDEVAAKHKGICSTETMMAELTEIFEALNAKNS